VSAAARSCLSSPSSPWSFAFPRRNWLVSIDRHKRFFLKPQTRHLTRLTDGKWKISARSDGARNGRTGSSAFSWAYSGHARAIRFPGTQIGSEPRACAGLTVIARVDLVPGGRARQVAFTTARAGALRRLWDFLFAFVSHFRGRSVTCRFGTN
jgi:hypothetical protein